MTNKMYQSNAPLLAILFKPNVPNLARSFPIDLNKQHYVATTAALEVSLMYFVNWLCYSASKKDGILVTLVSVKKNSLLKHFRSFTL